MGQTLRESTPWHSYRYLSSPSFSTVKSALGSSQTIPDVAPELWAIIASFSSRQSLAHLCSVSHHFYSTFSRTLYEDIIAPPLTSSQSSLLVKTLSDAQTHSWKPHPATLIRQLGLTNVEHSRFRPTQISKAQVQVSTDSLKNLYRLAPQDEFTRGSVLRSLHWGLAAGLDELGQILGTQGHFPKLRELSVVSNGTNNNFNVSAILVCLIPAHQSSVCPNRRTRSIETESSFPW